MALKLYMRCLLPVMVWQGVAGYRWATANDLEGRDPVSWAISYSTDCVNFVSFRPPASRPPCDHGVQKIPF